MEMKHHVERNRMSDETDENCKIVREQFLSAASKHEKMALTIINQAERIRQLEATLEWQPMETAPKDCPILAWCDHEADPFIEDEASGRLTTYAAHAETWSKAHVPTGYNILEWGGGFWEDNRYTPDWWFVQGSDFEFVANPVKWKPLSGGRV